MNALERTLLWILVLNMAADDVLTLVTAEDIPPVRTVLLAFSAPMLVISVAVLLYMMAREARDIWRYFR